MNQGSSLFALGWWDIRTSNRLLRSKRDVQDPTVVSMMEWLCSRAEGALDKDNCQEAIRCYHKLILIHQGDPIRLAQDYALLGDIYLGMGQYPKAFRNFRKALDLNAHHPHYHYLLGFTFAKVRQWSHARSCFTRALKAEPKNSEYLRGLGWSLLMLGEVRSGESLLKEAHELDPENLWPLVDLAYSYFRRRAYAEAIPLFEEALKRDAALINVEDALEECRAEVQTQERMPRWYRIAGTLPRSSGQTVAEANRLITRHFLRPSSPFNLHDLRRALDLWADFIEQTRPKQLVGSSGWAAAVEMVTRESAAHEGALIVSELAALYQSTGLEVLRKARVLQNALKLETASTARK